MTRADTLQVLTVLKVAYPAFYGNQSREELEAAVALWQDIFGDYPLAAVSVAVRELIKTKSGYPPDIAAVMDKLKAMTAAALGEPTDEDLWQQYKRAVADSGYCEQKTFNTLPEVLKRFAGSPRGLYDHAMMPADTFNSVVHGQFLRQIPIMRERQEYHDSLPEATKQVLASAFKRLQGEHTPLLPEEFNDRRNSVLNALEGM